MDLESLQIEFEWASNLEQPHGGFNFGELCLILDEAADINNKVRENVSRSRRRDILRLRMPCSCLFISGFANA